MKNREVFVDFKLGTGDRINTLAIIYQLLKNDCVVYVSQPNNPVYINMGLKQYTGLPMKTIKFDEQPLNADNLIDFTLNKNSIEMNIDSYNEFMYNIDEKARIQKSNEVLISLISEIKQKSLPMNMIKRIVEMVRHKGCKPITYDIKQKHYNYNLRSIFKEDEIRQVKGHFTRDWIIEMAKFRYAITIEGGAGLTALANKVPTIMFMSFRKTYSTLKYFDMNLYKTVEPEVDCFPCNACADYGKTFEVYDRHCNYKDVDYPCCLYDWEYVDYKINDFISL